MVKINNISTPAAILIGSIVLGSFYIASQIVKQKSIERQQQVEIQEEWRAEREAALQTAEEQKNEGEEQQEKEFRLWVNACIVEAQEERDRRLRAITQLTWSCYVDEPLLTKKDCDEPAKKAESGVNSYYQEWVHNCERGIVNDYGL